ncbi:3-hydroxy-3-methylglutaryl-coenzyme A reductase [ANME-1 cluster archaeon GoMg2]|nr:3-hydroxy-3-methylglutaryl-coenzyme A reductase [ANME-1 cluster archaeon GoMg2]
MEDQELIDKLVKHELKFHELEQHVDAKKATELRRRTLEVLTGKKLQDISVFSLDAERAVKANIENLIGAAQVPLGVAGPVQVRGDFADGLYHLPLATTEGALVASVNRGCTAINKSDGAASFVIKDGMARAPVLKARNISHAKEALAFLEHNTAKLKEITESTSKFLKFKEIQSWVVGRNLFLRFVFKTGDAMGMNMATIATDKAVKFLESETGLKHVALSGNVCVDKKSSALNLIQGRGKTVISEVVLTREVIKQVLKTSPESMADIVYRKCLLGSALAASYGFNAQFANVIAAIFIATGQDAAHVVEGSQGFTTAELTEEGDLLFSVTIPSLQVGTVGGGTALGTQREALELIGVHGAGEPPGSNALKFAEIVGAAVLAGEISLIGALGARHLAEAHVKLNR